MMPASSTHTNASPAHPLVVGRLEDYAPLFFHLLQSVLDVDTVAS